MAVLRMLNFLNTRQLAGWRHIARHGVCLGPVTASCSNCVQSRDLCIFIATGSCRPFAEGRVKQSP
jgi:hypothetical protein